MNPKTPLQGKFTIAETLKISDDVSAIFVFSRQRDERTE